MADYIYANITGTGKNATSKVVLGLFDISRNGVYRPSIRLSNLNGAAASITLYAELLDDGSNTLGTIAMTKPKPAAADTVVFEDFPQGGISMRATEQLNIYILSTNASDTSVNYDVYLFDLSAADVWRWKNTAPADLSGTYVLARNEDGAKIGTGTGAALTAQGVADSLKLAPTAGTPATGSVYDGLTSVGVDGQDIANALKLAPAAGTPATGSVYDLLTGMPASVWANGTRTLSSFGTLVADTASATVTALVALATATVTSSSGFLKYIHTSLASLLTSVSSGVTVSVGSNVAADGETLTLVQGEAYLDAISNAITMTIVDSRFPSTLSSGGSVPKLMIGPAGSTSATLTLNGIISSYTDASKTAVFKWDMTAAQSLTLTAGERASRYQVDVLIAGVATNVLTCVADGPCTVRMNLA